MKRILIANIFGIGDVLFTTPLISNIKKSIPGVKISYLCNQRARDIVELIPEVDSIFVYEKDYFAGLWNSSKIGMVKAAYGFFTEVSRGKFDAVIDLTLSRKFGFFWIAAGIRRRIGLNFRRRGLFLTDKITLDGFSGKHVADHYLELLELIGVSPDIRRLSLAPRLEDREKASAYMRDKISEYGPVVALVPGGGGSWGEHAARKRWDPIGFSRTGDILSGKGFNIVVLGDPSEKELCEEVASKMDKYPIGVINDLSLKQYAAFLAECDLVVCNDGGPLHIASATGTMTVSVFGPVDNVVYGPYPPSERNAVISAEGVSCRPCYNSFKLPECRSEGRCLLDIAPEDVAAVSAELLREAGKL